MKLIFNGILAAFLKELLVYSLIFIHHGVNSGQRQACADAVSLLFHRVKCFNILLLLLFLNTYLSLNSLEF